MTATKQDVDMNEGETKKLVIPQTDDEDNGGDLNISGYQSLTWFLDEWKGGPTIVEKTASGSSDVRVTDESIGAYEVDIVPGDTDGILGDRHEGKFYHRVRLVDSSGNESDLLEGEVTVESV